MTEQLEHNLPRFFRVRQLFDTRQCSDIKKTVRMELERSGIASQVGRGQSVAITAGSRGITDIAQIIQAAVAYFVELGAEPFIVPAMGSHGGGTAAGQRAVIESYGITEEFCGCPIRSSMETQVIGQAKEGFPVYFDRHAYAADHVVVCGRIKSHTNFAGDIQSGLMKMMMIGLGKKDGAALYHQAIHEHGFPQIIRSVAPKVIEHANILVGLAIVENANDQTAHIEAALPADFQARETELLQLSKRLMPTLPFREIDLLIVDEIGKNISGTGMDTNVIGRKRSEKTAEQPTVEYIFVRNLTDETHGNASGIGFAEFCLTRVVESMDREATVLNCLTALDVDGAKIPVYFATDREALTQILALLGMKEPTDARVVWIRNTGQLRELICSEALMNEVRGTDGLQAITDPEFLSFDQVGMLPDDSFKMQDSAD